jgi:hypothetical protein
VGNLTSISSFSKVDKRETTNEGGLVSKRGKKIKIGGHIDYPYPIESVMVSQRGGDSPSAHQRPLGARDYTPVHTGKKDPARQINIGLG